MNKKDFNNFNGYLHETFKNRVRLNENLDIEINYITRLNIQLKSEIIVPEDFKKSYLKFCDYLLTSDVVNEIISTLYQFSIQDLEYLRENNN
mgnify:CR=1 FL=1